LFSAVVVILAAFALLFGAKFNTADARSGPANTLASATFAANGATLGSIPDGTALVPPACGAPRDVTFTVTGLTGSVTGVKVAFSANHTWVGDVEATLIAPNGASHLLFARTGATNDDPNDAAFGYDDDLVAANTYSFEDSATTNWWTSAGVIPTVPTSDNRTVISGGAGTTDPAAVTNMNSDFIRVVNANGTWTLRFRDCSNTETGNVTAATLTLNAGGTFVPDANVDMDGDGKTDYAVTREGSASFSGLAGPSLMSRRLNSDVRLHPSQMLPAADTANLVSSPIIWNIAINGSGTASTVEFGDATTDFVINEDFDGDGKDDIAVWTPSAQATFKILQSSNNTVRMDDFGLPGDFWTVVGDYDGDGKADPAVFRCPLDPAPAGQCYFFYRGSFNNPQGNTTYIPWGYGTDFDFFPYVGDFDGDGKNDFCLQADNPDAPGHAIFYLLKANGGVEFIPWGFSTDVLVPGDYDGDGKTDFCVRRGNDPTEGARTFYILTRTGATSQIQWGTVHDVSAPGDYDGDGRTDIAIWRGSAAAGTSSFWIYNLSNGAVTVFPYGQCPDQASGVCDVPVASWAVQ